jgi:integrase/recombinase XerC
MVRTRPRRYPRRVTPLEQYIAEDDRLRPRTRTEYLRAVRKYVEFAGPNPSGWTYASVVAWRRHLRARRLKPQTINGYLAGVKRASINYARMNQDPALDFGGMVETLKKDRPDERLPLDEGEAQALIAACEGHRPIDYRDRAVLVFMLRTGVRRGGVVTARNYTGQNIDITLKGGATHTIKNLDDETRHAIDEWMYVLETLGVVVGKGHVFRAFTRNGKPCARITTSAVYKIVTSRAIDADIGRPIHPHLLRHTFISWCRRYGVPDWRIRQITGQQTVQILDTYTTDQDPTPVGDALPRMR